MAIFKPRHKRAAAQRMALAVTALQLALLVALWATPGEPPRGSGGAGGVTLWQLLWASARKPTFYPLVALLLAGPALSVVAWRIAGRHRLWLVTSWVAFAAIALPTFGDRLSVMLRVLWWQYGT